MTTKRNEEFDHKAAPGGDTEAGSDKKSDYKAASGGDTEAGSDMGSDKRHQSGSQGIWKTDPVTQFFMALGVKFLKVV